jgi:hypothetical protein
MRCPLELDQSAELIVGYGARTLDPETTAAFERHLESCPACCKLAAAQAAVWSALDDPEWLELPVSPDFDRRLFQRIEQAENRAGWLWRRLVPVAALAGLVVAATLQFSQPQTVRVPQAPQAAVQIEQVEHALDDMDLLNQLGAAVTAEPSGSSKRL